MFLAVNWNVDPTFFSLFGIEIRYYALMWVCTFLIGMWMFNRFVRTEGYEPKVFDSVFFWGFFSTIIGARLGHCLFYEPMHYLTHPWEIITGFRDGGLASHGAALGLLLGLWAFSRINKIPYIWSLDRIMLPVSIGGALVRIGNLINSEVYGQPTDLPWGFIFERRGEILPMHPTQIYEAICYLVVFLVLVWMYWGRDLGRRRPGVMFGTGLIGIFVSRFFIEFIKLPQEAFEQGWLLDMGQWLSIPFIIAGVWILVRALRADPRPPSIDREQSRRAEKEEKKRRAAENIICK